jgi:CBS domain-containing protein
MKVTELMTTEVKTCRQSDSLNRAAQLMWENDCGAIPVVDSELTVIGMLTDRDICMAAYTQGVPLTGASVGSAMSGNVRVCAASDNITSAAELMREHQIRRLPVVDKAQKLVGILSMSDIAREAERLRASKSKKRPLKDSDLVETLGAISTRTTNGSASHAA